MSLRTGGLHHLTIRTTDLAKAKHFYIDTLGFQAVRERDGALLLNAHGTLFGVLGAWRLHSLGFAGSSSND
jgi:glyoxylase I family protein